MRLLNTTTFELHEFPGEAVPPYAILSHVWSAEELSYEDFTTGKRRHGHGFEKVVKLCELARTTGNGEAALNWAWSDTICIDKRSSAELSESINSMFRWYQKSAVCYVFLPDVYSIPADTLSVKADNVSAAIGFEEHEFVQSKWFTRGFTLQELLAPFIVLFYTSDFQLIGQKNGQSQGRQHHSTPRPLTTLIKEASGISVNVLEQSYAQVSLHSHGVSVAQRMSWVSGRSTTKPEDIAYCLLGLFNVNMPLLYGEGKVKAFFRLQREIVTGCSDDSIFAWETENQNQPWSGLLASSPSAFRNSGGVRYLDSRSNISFATHELHQKGAQLNLYAGHRLLPRPKRRSALQCLIYPLGSWKCTEQGRKEGRCYLKIWMEDMRSDERGFADDSTLAWRSGMFVLDREPDYPTYTYTSVRAASRQARSWIAQNLIPLNHIEKQVLEISTAHTRHISRPILRLSGRVSDKLGWVALNSIVKLCFPMRFEVEDTPTRLLTEKGQYESAAHHVRTDDIQHRAIIDGE